MKSILFFFVFSLLLFGCSNEIDTTPPKPPQGITTISLDNAIEIRWLPSQDDDVKGYNVWVSSSYNGKYLLIGSTSYTYFIDYGALNGNTYYYAVSAFDFNNNESALSKDSVYDTPRPEGYDVIIYDYYDYPKVSGYSFSQYRVVKYNDDYSDFYFSANEFGKKCLLVWPDTDIQDMGYTKSLDDISSAPNDGWSPSGSAEAIVGHTYVIWTVDNHYAKIRITAVGSNYIRFDWAYQTAVGNPELKVAQRTNKDNDKRVNVRKIE